MLSKKGALTELESATVLSSYGVQFPRMLLATSPQEAQKIVRKLSPPVVMKIASRDLPHKSEVGGVVTGVTENTAVATYKTIVRRVKETSPESKIDGVLVQEEVPRGVEVVVGGLQDLQFGHAIMFGLGGIFTEVFEDVTFRVVPITEKDAQEMIEDTHAAALLHGQRGHPSVNLGPLRHILLTVSKLLEEYPQIIELDLNPVIIKTNEAVAVDAFILLEEK